MNKSKKTAAPAATYKLVQIDDEGTRVVGSGFSSPRYAAMSIDGVVEGLDCELLATTWNANTPSGGERYEIGQDDE